MTCPTFDGIDLTLNANTYPPYVAKFVIPTPAFAIPGSGATTDYVHYDGAHWIVTCFEAGGTMTSFPGGTINIAVVSRISDDGSSVTHYEVPLDYYYVWGASLGAPYPDLCTFRLRVFRQSWHCKATSAKLASDGTNLWLAVLGREERPYPWYHQRFDIGYVPDPADFEAVANGGLGYLSYRGSSFCHGIIGAGPFDDLGVGSSQRWNPYQVTMFVLGGGGFDRIDELPARFVNNLGNSPDAWNGFSTFSDISLAASPAEPGVCHMMWSEAGAWGQRADASNFPNRGSRLNYTRWSSGAKTYEIDQLYYDQIFDLDPYPPPARPASPTIVGRVNAAGLPDSYGFPLTADDYGYTSAFVLKNDHGFPVAFVSRMILTDFGFSPTDTHAPDEAEPTIRMWDMRAPVMNIPAEMQTLDFALAPDASETIFGPTGVGWTPTRLRAESGTSSSVVSLDERDFAISPLYSDPLLADIDVYLLSVQWAAPRVAGASFANGIYRVPCDGSGPFDYLDGRREISVMPNATHVVLNTWLYSPLYVPVLDFFSEPRDLWIPAGSTDSTLGGLVYLDRICHNDWEFWQLAAAVSPESIGGGSLDQRVYYDPVADRFYYHAFYVDALGTPWDAIGRSQICRACRQCGDCVEGLHIWRRQPLIS